MGMDMQHKKDAAFLQGNRMGIRTALAKGIPLSQFRFEGVAFRASVEESVGDRADCPVLSDDVWQSMLRAVIGHVPKDAEQAPPCRCELIPMVENYDFAGLAGLPSEVRLMDGFFPIRDQSKRGSCFAFALVSLCEYMLGKTVQLSEQSLYHFTKLVTPGKIEDLDDGAIILDSIHAVEEYGICPLSEWHYNPESWNYVEDPYNEGQGKALQRKLASAQKYRFRNWRTLSQGSVLQFKQALAAKFPIYTGVLVTTDWDNENVRKTGVIPFPKLFWKIRVFSPSSGVVKKIMAENGIDASDEGSNAVAMKICAQLIRETLAYIASAVFKCDVEVLSFDESADGVEIVCVLKKVEGGHALCLAGYVDDDSYSGGGYFIARNSWSDDKWAPDSPEMPGYALIPYSYIAMYAQEGIVMSEFPDADKETSGSTDEHHGSAMLPGRMPLRFHAAPDSSYVAFGVASSPSRQMQGLAPSSSVAMSAAGSGFETWLARREMILDRPMRDQSGILLSAGTPVLVSNLSAPSSVIRDTIPNRQKLRDIYEEECRVAKVAADESRERRLGDVVRETLDKIFAADECAVVSLAELKNSLLSVDRDLQHLDALEGRLRALVIDLQKRSPDRCWFGRGYGGQEELRSTGRAADRIFV